MSQAIHEIKKIWEVIEYLKDAVALLNEANENDVIFSDVTDLLDIIDGIMSEEVWNTMN